MITYDVRYLLEKAFSCGFPVESLSKATDVPVELINRCYNGEELKQEDYVTLCYLLNFLTQLHCDTADSTYMHNIVSAICDYFMIPLSAIGKYLNLNLEELNIFLSNPESFTNGFNLSIRLMHLFTTLVRDKRL